MSKRHRPKLLDVKFAFLTELVVYTLHTRVSLSLSPSYSQAITTVLPGRKWGYTSHTQNSSEWGSHGDKQSNSWVACNGWVLKKMRAYGWQGCESLCQLQGAVQVLHHIVHFVTQSWMLKSTICFAFILWWGTKNNVTTWLSGARRVWWTFISCNPSLACSCHPLIRCSTCHLFWSLELAACKTSSTMLTFSFLQ